ncbi:MAG: phosphate ABC transporter permease [Pegethrix bostrychoides GSE-TBD4-15B]|jgi:hypothetical protein|uniref:Phosphate ABC transporter permease n=1 Tax=Pegethrix bostrychoides GSE-TBD4-15B TaxID=2839662 RepID=A0A951U494_9CYAN|nr:phosphate ABC transporter permease [Pegethrix bostrychoides GSE-TBD4-15B]
MLIPITRKKFEELVPLTATFNQYRFYWGKLTDILQRVLISVAGLVAVVVLNYFAGERFQIILAFLASATGLYWFWSPAYRATRRNLDCRKYKFSGFFEGEVLDTFITENLVGKEETVNKQGELVIIENRERRINLEISDDTGFVVTTQAPLLREHRSIRPGDTAQLLVMSNRGDLSRISFVSDVFLPESDLWVSEYPYLRRDIFREVCRQLGQGAERDQYQDPYQSRDDYRQGREPRRRSQAEGYDDRYDPRDYPDGPDDRGRGSVKRLRGSR